MQDDDMSSGSREIVTGVTPALAQRSTSIISRGLRSLSGWDAARVIEVGKELTSTRFTDNILSIFRKRIDEFLGVAKWALLLADEDQNELRYEILVGVDQDEVISRRIKFGSGIAGHVAQQAKSLIVADPGKDPLFAGKLEDLPLEKRAQSVVAVPLRFLIPQPSILVQAIEGLQTPPSETSSDQFDPPREKCIGVIELFDCLAHTGFPQSDLSLLESLTDFAAIALEKARYTTEVHSWSITDEQTGLYNSRHLGFILETEIYRSLRYSYEFSLVHIRLTELNGSGSLAKSLNYLSFNKLLNEIGQRMKDHGRLIDFAFRFDEGDIMFLLPQTTKENCCNVARRIHTLIGETAWLHLDGLNIRLSASIGLASFPADATTKEGILRLASEAMHLVKNSAHDGVAAANVGILPPL